MGTRQIGLSVNGAQIEIDYFVQRYVDHVVGGIVASLHSTSDVEALSLSIDGNSVALELNGKVVPMNDFVRTIVKNTVTGMVSSLKGVGDVDRLAILIMR